MTETISETRERIVLAVCRVFEVTREDIFSDRRLGNHVVDARHTAMWLTKVVEGLGPSRIAAVFGRDHSTVISALRKFERRRERSAWLARVSTDLRDEVQSRAQRRGETGR